MPFLGGNSLKKDVRNAYLPARQVTCGSTIGSSYLFLHLHREAPHSGFYTPSVRLLVRRWTGNLCSES